MEGDGDSHVMATVWIAEGMVGYSKVCLFLCIGWEAIGGIEQRRDVICVLNPCILTLLSFSK